MAQPQAYNRKTDFTERDGDDTNHAGVNTELDAAALSINEIRDKLALIQRDDGALKNGIVTAESLSDSAFNAVLGEVATATAAASAAADRSVLFSTQSEVEKNAAQAAAQTAAALLDNFDDRYLGSKTTNPTTDNDGNPLITGALYFNSVVGEMRVWAGTFWKAAGSSVNGIINTAKYTATAGQTTFAIVYDVGFVHVYLNGVKLESGVEFTANNGTTVVLATGATAGDVVDMIAFGTFSVANTYTKAEADALLSTKAPQATTYTKFELNAANGSSILGFQQSGTGAVQRTVDAELKERVSVTQFGAVGDGVTDDTVAINSAFSASSHVIVPSGMTLLISETITVAAGKCLEFKGGYGNPALNPRSYFIKKSTMTSAAIVLNQASVMIGGGVLGQVGNTGDGIVLAQNASKAIHPWVKSVGGVGIRVGTNAGDNSNCTELRSPSVSYCGSHGIYVHDGVGDDANAGTIYNPVSVRNGGDGIRLGHCYWVTVINGNCEVNTGWGLYLSGANKASYPECRWATIIGGDYNEGNIAGIVYDASYFSTFVNADGYNLPTTAPNGLQGSAIRTYIGGPNTSTFPSVNTTSYENVLSTANTVVPPLTLRTIGSDSVGNGPIFQFKLSQDAGVSYRLAGAIKSYQLAGTYDALDFSCNSNGTLTSIFKASTYYNGVSPTNDNTFNLGHPSFRWGTVYAATGTISTSDLREKQQIRDVSKSERAVAIQLKSMIRAFKWNDSVKQKGDDARIHFGVIAQEVKAVFEAEGLDAMKYGVLCYDEWDDEFEPVMASRKIEGADGDVVTEEYDTGEKRLVRSAGNRYGVRHDQLFALIISAL